MNCRALATLFLPISLGMTTPVFAESEGGHGGIVAAAPGRIEGSSDMISIGASINGIVERVLARQGDRVTSGQVLVNIV